jgi:biotin synthase
MSDLNIYLNRASKKIEGSNGESVLDALDRGDIAREVLGRALLFKGCKRQGLFVLARKRRSEFFSDKVEVRSVIEISNVCGQRCNFCNINSYSRKKRYTIGYDELMQIVENIYRRGRRVLLLQSGENRSGEYIDFVCECIKEIKQKFGNLIIILCLGNLTYNQYRQLKGSGADRYILKFETSNPGLYRQIKPSDSLDERVGCIKQLVELGFEVGSGNIVGLPGQTIDDLVDDLLFTGNFKLTMASSSVFIPGEDSNYRDRPMGDIDLTLNYMALMRIMYPRMLIPSTSSLERAKKGGQYLGLMAGANTVTVHDGTPAELKRHYPIYSTNRFTPDERHIRDIVQEANLIFG